MTELPTTFGKYYLTEKLATGGMAEIYLAKLIGPGGFEKSLVIKQIHPRLTGQRHFVDLFVAEAKTLVALTHGNIVPVYELGVVDDTYFIAMEYIDGPTLYRLTERMAARDEVMKPDVAAWITARIAEGLDYAHRKGEGVIHRDLSPRNVMLSRDGEVKLVDFGIAVTLGEGDRDSAQSAPTGSFPYMSPEQVRREPLSGQTDLFSLGVLCWEMLVGRRLFARHDPDATLEAVLSGDIPRPSSLRAEIPAKLDEVVMRALERDQAARWPSAGDLLAALNRYLYALDETPGPRDVAALVATFCPPETRRLPTHLESVADVAGDEDSAPVASGPATVPAPAPKGPATAVIPKDGSQPKGKRPQRAQTFATNVQLEDMLSRATPLFPIDAIKDEPAPAEPDVVSSATRPTERTAERADDRRSERADDRRGAVAPPMPVPGRNPPSRAALVVLGLGGLALGGGALYVFYQGRSAVLGRDAAVDAAIDAGRVDAAIDAPGDAAGDAAPDAPQPADAPVTRPDAAVRMTIDAAVAHDAAPADAAGTATLTVGADPWGNITIDGKSYGQTPKTITVAAGHHMVEIVFPAESPPRKQTFAIDVTAGETKPIQADFH
ncbi:MAG: serine/threonine protein kinase [Deltaproteobacteria bacterium]|nr:serine/threonine protein kinase [Deltaproteobacteria bacterium]